MRAVIHNITEDARKIAEITLAGILTPAAAGTAAELLGAGMNLESLISGLAWTILAARVVATGLELWERYFTPPSENVE